VVLWALPPPDSLLYSSLSHLVRDYRRTKVLAARLQPSSPRALGARGGRATELREASAARPDSPETMGPERVSTAAAPPGGNTILQRVASRISACTFTPAFTASV
jgi:hypothetical protein